MNKSLLTILVSVSLLSGCSLQSYVNEHSRDTRNAFQEGNFTGSMQEGNYVYGAAMNLAWQELGKSILQTGDVEVLTDDETVLTLARKFNDSMFTRNDLNEASYYIASGFGQETVARINRESKNKFPSKSFDDLALDLGQCDAIAYAYFLKEVEYITMFSKTSLSFLGESVEGFQASSKSQRATVAVSSYDNDDKFIVRLRLKQDSDELYLIKGYDMSNPDRAIATLFTQQGREEELREGDVFRSPEVHLSVSRTYREFLQKQINSAVTICGQHVGTITAMFENIKFDMDEKGARVENEGVVSTTFGMGADPTPTPRNFILDKPYWIIMKEKGSNNPYFALGINNSAFMVTNQ